MAAAMILLLASGSAEAQILTKTVTYEAGGTFVMEELGATGENRQNEYYYRFRENVSEELKPGKMAKALNLECVIAEKNYDGTYIALYRTPLSGDFDNDGMFVAALYDKKKKLKAEVSLTALAGFTDSEVQDLRYYDGLIYFNMPYITYSSGVDGQCSKLYCVNPKTEEIVWETPYLYSNGIFIVDENYVVCGYGFTDEDDFVFLLDRSNGDCLTKMPVHSSPVYYEFNEDGDLIVMDYNENVYLFSLEQQGLKVTGSGVRLRMEPSLEGEIYSESENGRPKYAMKGDILPYAGEAGDFYHVLYNGMDVFIYKQYGEVIQL